MIQQTEVLNIDYHVKHMTIKALNKFNKIELAAAALGVNKRTISRYQKRFNIFWDKRDSKFKEAV